MSPSLSKSPKAHPRLVWASETPGPGFVNQLFESAITQIPKHQAWSAKRVCRNFLFDFGIDAACGHEEIGQSVIVQINHASAPSNVARLNPQSRVNRHVVEVSFAVIVIENVGIVGKVCFENVEIAVKINSRPQLHPCRLAPARLH